MKHYIFAIIFLILGTIPVFAEKTHDVIIDDKSFTVSYDLDGKLIAMDVDRQSISLLLGTKDVRDSEFKITIPPELLSAQNNDFVVLVDGIETDYTIEYESDKPTISFFLPAGTEEIEIIGTSVIPEFSVSAILTMSVVFGILFLIKSGSNYV